MHALEITRRNRVVKTLPKMRHAKVTPFVLEGGWMLDGLDQRTMRSLSKVAKRKRAGVADVISFAGVIPSLRHRNCYCQLE